MAWWGTAHGPEDAVAAVRAILAAGLPRSALSRRQKRILGWGERLDRSRTRAAQLEEDQMSRTKKAAAAPGGSPPPTGPGVATPGVAPGAAASLHGRTMSNADYAAWLAAHGLDPLGELHHCNEPRPGISPAILEAREARRAAVEQERAARVAALPPFNAANASPEQIEQRRQAILGTPFKDTFTASPMFRPAPPPPPPPGKGPRDPLELAAERRARIEQHARRLAARAARGEHVDVRGLNADVYRAYLQFRGLDSPSSSWSPAGPTPTRR